jgi:2-polyprenyl-3-methyl-5-hydroxy-6-metoxy-1,4-benzoquinol methylase
MPHESNEFTERQQREQAFHDQKYGKVHKGPAIYRVHPTYRVFQALKARLGDVRDKTILEIGCGDGWITKELALMGAKVSAFDVSTESVRKTRKELERLNLADRCDVRVMAAESMDYPAASFDAIVGFAILHHLDLPNSFRQFRAVLRPNGRVLAAEPLDNNPLITAYRRLTPQFRTEDEQPIDLYSFVREYSSDWNIWHREYYLTALLALGLAYVPGGSRIFEPVARALDTLDERLVTSWPSLGKFAWFTLLDMRLRV